MPKADELQQLQAKVEQLEAIVAQLTGQSAQPKRLEPHEKPDYIAFGSERHATLLGLEKDGDDWRDMTEYGPLVMPEYRERMLQMKIRELNTKPAIRADAPPMWMPADAQEQSVIL